MSRLKNAGTNTGIIIAVPARYTGTPMRSLLLFLISGLMQLFGQQPVRVPTGADGLPQFTLPEIHILAPYASDRQRKKALKDRARFERLRYNVEKVYPYAKIFARNFTYLHNTLQTIEDASVREAFKNKAEKDLFGKYEKDLRDMTVTQGKILIKLLHRESGQTAFQGIRDLKSGASAVFWQGVARIFGNNLKSEYDPEEEAAIERILAELESR